MTALKSQPLSPPSPQRGVAPLENGDRLTRVEFERRYAAMPSSVKAELIEGIVYMASPVRHRRHSKPHVILSNWLGHYIARTPGLDEFGDNGTVRLDEDNEPQPDLMLMLPAIAGGQTKVTEDDYIEGPPDLACEIAASSVSIDLHAKRNVYRRNRIKEYFIWRTQDAAVDWLLLRDGNYEPLVANADGVLKSQTFPGLWLDVAALIRGDLPKLFQVIGQGTATPEHAAFVGRLKAS